MNEKPHAALLNREEPQALAKDHFGKQTALLRDLANYGSNLVIRAFDSSPKGMAEIVVCGVLLKQVVSMVDAAEVLLSSGCGHAAFLPARTAFEASVYIDWVLESASELRATRYIVANFRDERVWANRVTPGTLEEAAFGAISKLLDLDIHAHWPSLSTDAVGHLAEVNRILAQPKLATVDQEFDSARTKRMRRDVDWYALDNGPVNLRQVSSLIGRLPEYELFYARGSQVTHTGTYKDHIRFVNKEARFKPIRHLAEVNFLLNCIVSVSLHTYRKVLTRYRPGEVNALSKKYVDDWRDPFLNVLTVKYKGL
jgi:hypothetical protein